ncbi:MAG: hypothetical protein RR914_06215 [Oscillospiraceae bacterium]
MKKSIRLFICLLAVILLFSGCKIEKVEEVALETTTSIIAESDSETIAESNSETVVEKNSEISVATTSLTNVSEKSSEFGERANITGYFAKADRRRTDD